MSGFSEILNASLVALFDGVEKHPVSHRHLKVEKYYQSEYEISSHISFFETSGKKAGVALLNVDGNHLVDIWKEVLQMPVSEETSAFDIATELTNMIVGNASARFHASGYKIQIALPHIINCNPQMQLSTLKRDDFHYFEFSTATMRFNWVLCFYDTIGFST